MRRRGMGGPTGAWRVLSVAVKMRDGPHRLDAAYRILLRPELWSPQTARHAAQGDCQENIDGSGPRRAGLHRAPGTRADD